MKIYLILNFYLLILLILQFPYFLLIFFPLLVFFVWFSQSKQFLQLKSNPYQHSISLPHFLITILAIPIFIVVLIPLNLTFITLLVPIISLLLLFIPLVLKIAPAIITKHWYFEFNYFTVHFILNHVPLINYFIMVLLNYCFKHLAIRICL